LSQIYFLGLLDSWLTPSTSLLIMDAEDNLPEEVVEAPAATAESAVAPAVVEALKSAEGAAGSLPVPEDDVLQHKVVRQRMSILVISHKRQ
jgi:hypothetical protein